MKKILSTLACVVVSCAFSLAQSITSPSGKLTMDFKLADDGAPRYSLRCGDIPVILESGLGLKLRSGNHVSKVVIGQDGSISKVFASPDFDLTRGFVLEDSGTESFDETWQTVWGEESEIRNCYNELHVTLSHKASGRVMGIRFRVYDDGMALRYEFPKVKGLSDYMIVSDECTEFALASDHTAWWIPGDYDSQEYEYTCSRVSEIPEKVPGALRANPEHSPFSVYAVQTSLQMRADDGMYINIHEAALTDYSCMHLQLIPGTLTFKSALTPNPEGDMAVLQAPCHTPWRTVQVAQNGAQQLSSRMILNLNEPCALEDVSWIHPTKYIGVWWEMISNRGTWAGIVPDGSTRIALTDYAAAQKQPLHSANTANVKKYIDYAADNGFDEVLVEGWNIGWEDWESFLKEDVFDFVTPSPDFDIEALNEYAASKGVKLIMHHETSSSMRNYERRMEAAYSLMNKYGYDAVKSGYVGDIYPRGEYRFGQAAINHYQYAISEAARHHIMVNAHEAVRPTGLCRTYPNMVGNESAMGTEYQAFGGISAGHVTILPFTRLNGGPMDYTPGIFEMDMNVTSQGRNSSHVNATICNQLGLYLTMPSPLQMAADLPENYERFPDAFQFIKDVPCDWSESRYLDAEIGDYIVVARKGRKDGCWYVGGVTDEQARTVSVDFSFLPEGKRFEATVYRDAPDADYRTAPQKYVVEKTYVTRSAKLDFTMAPGGGFAISLKEIPGVCIVPQPVSFIQNEGSVKITDGSTIWIGNAGIAPVAYTFLKFIRQDPVPSLKIAKTPRKASIFLSLDPSLQEEEYTLDADPENRIHIAGGSPKGVWWGLQTLLQVMVQTTSQGVCLYPSMKISDAPKFSYRGAHLDCCRHFFGVDQVKRYIDMMAIHKLNTLHWHLTDNEGWRIEIKRFPRLTEVGSVRKETVVGHYYVSHVFDGTPYGGFFTQEEAKEIVAYAAARQIEVIPEIESPGHCLAALASYPFLGCRGEGYEVGRGLGASKDVFCPGKESTYEFLFGVIDELCEIFPSEYIHIGGDEVKKDMWKECPECQALMKREGMTDVSQLQNYFVKRMEDYILSKGRKMIGWDEILDGGVSQSAVVMSWRGAKGGIAAAKLGNDVIMCPSTHFYFDHPQYRDKSDALDICGGDYRILCSIRQGYSFDPFDQLTPEESSHILGMQCCLWTELIPDDAQLQKMALPRMAALCECAWGTKTDTEDFITRTDIAFIPWYLARGYNPAELYK